MDLSLQNGKEKQIKSSNHYDDPKIQEFKTKFLEERRKRESLEQQMSVVIEKFSQEEDRVKNLQYELMENHKRVRMMTNGTEKLDHILSIGQPSSVHWGLGFNDRQQEIKHHQEVKVNPAKNLKFNHFIPASTSSNQNSVKKESKLLEMKKKPIRKGSNSCRHCCEEGHSARSCYERKTRFRQLWKSGKCYVEPKHCFAIWVSKKDLYAKNSSSDIHYNSEELSCYKAFVESDRDQTLEETKMCTKQIIFTEEDYEFGVEDAKHESEDKNLIGHVAYITGDQNNSSDWYFDSGCSRHMTGDPQLLKTHSHINGGKVTFGDGGKGKIKAVGTVGEKDQPRLVNVYLVQGLKANLISISQLCDEGLKVIFTKDDCQAVDENGNIVLFGIRSGNNCYMWKQSEKCLSATESPLDLWHKRLGHMNVQTLNKLVNAEVIRGVPKLGNQLDAVCEACNKGKQIKVQHKKTTDIGTTKILELVHMDLMGPMQIESIAGKKYAFVLVDDFSRFTWVRFLREKSEAVESFKYLFLELKAQKGSIIQIRSDHGGEFQNTEFKQLCLDQGIRHQFSAPRTPQQNGVVERKNRTLQEMARAMLHGNQVSARFWAEAVSTACYIINRIYVKPGTKTTPYEIWKGKTPNVGYFHVFGCVCYILNDQDHLGKFDSRSDTGIFLGYATNSMAFRVFNYRTKTIIESVNVVFDDRHGVTEGAVSQQEETRRNTTEALSRVQETGTSEERDDVFPQADHEISTVPQIPQVHRNHSPNDVIGDINAERKTRGKRRDYTQMGQFACFVSLVEPKNWEEALLDEFWVSSMHEEIEQFTRLDVWDLMPKPVGVNIVGTKWIFKNKMDDEGNIVRNKARLVAQGYSQIEGVDFDETFAPVARLESIRLLLGLACDLKIKLFQMDVKSAFLNGLIQEEVFVSQPKGFEDPKFPNHVYKLKKALYGLKQAPRAWYERLAQFLLQSRFKRGGVDKTLFILDQGHDMLVVQIYVDDIIFGATSEKMISQFVKTMTKEFEMSMVGELNYFLGLQVKQMDDGIFVSQSTYAKNLIAKFDMHTCKTANSPMGTTLKLSKDEEGKRVDERLYRAMIGSLLYLTASRPDLCLSVGICARYQANPRVSHLAAVKRILKYVKGTMDFGLYFTKDTNLNLAGFCDADWAGGLDDRKSTSGGCFFLGNNLISWHSKKQNCISLSTAEAEYIALGSCCTQLLWMKHMLADYGKHISNPIMVNCDNMSAINISKNPVQHSRTKHIDIRHHFVRELVEDKIIEIKHVNSENQLADIFTKPLDVNTFLRLRKSLGVCSL